MNAYPVSDDYRPITWVGRYPVFLTALLVAFHTICMVALSIYVGIAGGALLETLSFNASRLLARHDIWTLATYPFVHMASPWFLLDMLMLFWFGQQVERFLGRRAFVQLYAVVILAAPLSMLLVARLPDATLVGSSLVHMAIFVAFAMIYPNAELIFHIQAKWFAIAIVAISLLAAFAAQNWAGIIALVSTLVAACVCLHLHGVERFSGITDAISRIRKARPERTRKPPEAIGRTRPAPGNARSTDTAETDPLETIDPLLEKISKQGLSSLSPAERRKLEAARATLLSRGDRH